MKSVYYILRGIRLILGHVNKRQGKMMLDCLHKNLEIMLYELAVGTFRYLVL